MKDSHATARMLSTRILLVSAVAVGVGFLDGAFHVLQRGYLGQDLPLLALLRIEEALVRCLVCGVAAGVLLIGGTLLRPRLFSAIDGRRIGRAVRVAGILALIGAAALFAATSLALHLGGPDGPNVVLISIDTLRADRCSLHGHARPTTPHLDELAGRGLVCERALAQAPWTLPSMATIHTGRYPHEHGAFTNSTRIAESELTLAECFRGAGYRTAAVVSHTFVGRAFGFAQGFEDFDDRLLCDEDDISSPQLAGAALEAVDAMAGRPFFLWVHCFDPHFDYVGHEEFPWGAGYDGDLGDAPAYADLYARRDSLTDRDLDFVRGLYDGEIAFTDLHIGRLLAGLADRGLADRTIVALVGDHGEQFLEHGDLGHGRWLWGELLHVPLVIHDPRRDGAVRLEHPVEVRHLARTLLAAAGLGDSRMAGEDLRAAAAAPVFSEGSYAWGADGRQLAVVLGSWKLIHHFDDGRRELYDLATDPGESRDRLAEGPDSLAELTTLLEDRLRRMATGAGENAAAVLGEDERRRLESLGYL